MPGPAACTGGPPTPNGETRLRHRIDRVRGLAAPAGLLLIAACAPPAPPPAPAPEGLPPVPRVEGELAVRVVHPVAGSPRPDVDSTYVYGSVGTGAASLTVEGVPVEVAPNGAFLAYLPLPADGRWDLSATAGGRTEEASVAYRPPPPPSDPAAPAAPRPAVEELAPALEGRITGVSDTLATGSGVAIGRPTPTGTYRWFLPRGARVAVTGRLGDQVRVQLGDSVAWLGADEVELGGPAATEPRRILQAVVQGTPAWVDVRLGVEGAPFLVETTDSTLTLHLYGVAPPPPELALRAGPDGVLTASVWTTPSPGVARLDLALARRLWGYKAFYEADGTLVLRLRRPPEVDPASPLRGRRIAIDPGHPPGGATGPTGLREAEANLAISLPLAERLRAAGAEVLLTRTDGSAVPLEERVNRAVEWDAELLVSVHNNAFAEGVNPFRNHGTSVYYFHPHAASLARALDAQIVRATRIRDLGARRSNLALARPTWMPAALTESLFMLIPEHEAALRDPAFLDRLAAAHVRGIEAWLRER